MTRGGRFRIGLDGGALVGGSSVSFGNDYRLRPSSVDTVRRLYADLEAMESQPSSPPNVMLAVRRFSASVDRGMMQRQDRLVDAVTTLEALVGSDQELSFKVAFRVANLLGTTDDETVEVFQTVRAFYAVRSLIVHGATLKAKHLELVNDQQPLESITRRLLVAVIEGERRSSVSFTTKYVNEQLDKALVHSVKRRALQEALDVARMHDLHDVVTEEES